MINTVVGVLVAGILGAIAIVITYDVVQDAFYTAGNYTGPAGVIQAIAPMIPVVVGVVVIVGMFMLLTKLA